MKIDNKVLLAGLFAGVLGVGAGYLLGSSTNQGSPSKFLIGNRTGLIYEAILDNPDITKEEAKKNIVDPINAILMSYRDQGFIVIDGAKDDQGHYNVIALPQDARDISSELKDAITPKKQ